MKGLQRGFAHDVVIVIAERDAQWVDRAGITNLTECPHCGSARVPAIVAIEDGEQGFDRWCTYRLEGFLCRSQLVHVPQLDDKIIDIPVKERLHRTGTTEPP